MPIDSVAILDCGGQYTKVIDRRVRELCVRSEILPIDIETGKLAGFGGIILSGGPASIWSDAKPCYDRGLFDLGIPVLGICYGMHLMNVHFGGKVKPGIREEYGQTGVRIDSGSALFKDLAEEQTVLMSHGDSVAEMGSGFEPIALSGDVIAGISNEARRFYGVQFHPEVDLTVSGMKMLSNFLYGTCGLEGNYVLEDRIDAAISKIRRKVGEKRVLVLVSGGVDSVVSATLLLRALEPRQVIAVHVDHGLMRKDESREICAVLRGLGFQRLICVNAEEEFLYHSVEENGRILGPLVDARDPEIKRRIIGNHFIRVVYDTCAKLNLDWEEIFIAQGTLRPDLIESGNPDVSRHAHRIKTHHNDVDVVRIARAEGRIVETNWDWHKDEVREVARRLGIPESIAGRQPFPGPGLAIRFICHHEGGGIRRQQRREFGAYCRRHGLTGKVLPLKTVGVQGDSRSYRNLALLWGKGLDEDWKNLTRVGIELPGRLSFVNRVVYLLNAAEMEGGVSLYPTGITRAGLDLLRDVDAVVRNGLDRQPISQVFAVLLPLGRKGKHSVVVRTFITNDYMTGRPGVIGEDVDRGAVSRIVEELGLYEALDLILYDVTGKPPATVEWE